MEQTLDDLSFVFGNTVAKLRPKFVIMENVEGLIKGEAFTYVQKIYKQFKDMGYRLKHWLLKGETMGVPQTRHRVFFIGVRNDINFDLDKMEMGFDYEPVTYGEIKAGTRPKMKESSESYKLVKNSLPTDKSLGDINLRLYNKLSAFQTCLVNDNSIIPTLRSKPDVIDRATISYITRETMIHSQTFPEDYNFGDSSYSKVGYVCGMSVPPLMIKRIVKRMIENGLLRACDKSAHRTLCK